MTAPAAHSTPSPASGEGARSRDVVLGVLFDTDYIASTTGRRYKDAEEALGAYRQLPEDERFDPSVFFSRAFYRNRHFDIALGHVDPVLHFLESGFREERAVHPLFDAALLRERLHRPDASMCDLWTDFAIGKIDVSPHLLLDLAWIRRQLGADLSAVEMFALVADLNCELSIAPHPLFSPAYYALNGDRAVRNALADYIGFNTSAAHVHPLFSPDYYLASRRDNPDIPALLLYLRHWRDFGGDPSLLVDLKFINHQLALRNIHLTFDPLTEALYHSDDGGSLMLHPHIDPRVIDFAFGNMIGEAGSESGAMRLTSVLERTAQETRRTRGVPTNPVVSVIILNYCKPAYTLLSVLAATNALRNLAHEIVVIDNGGEPFHFEEMSRLLRTFPSVHLHKMTENKLFGEGNNIGIDKALGDNILFLNNDCFLHESFGRELQRIFEAREDVHVVGATLHFPDGKIQEFGGAISDCGQVIQRAKGLDADFIGRRTDIEQVDYVSAACLLVSRRAIGAVAGFDPAFEPLYYEDTDLCRRLKVAGFSVNVSPKLRAMHIENATTREFLGAGFHDMIGRNRMLFARRWLREGGAGVLAPGGTAERKLPASLSLGRRKAVIYTPFDIRAGGGERYLLSAARALAATHDVVIATEGETSRARIRFVCHALGIEPFAFSTATLRDVLSNPARPDIALVMGNEIVPPVPAFGRRNIYHLQFPFPWRNIGRYDFRSVTSYDFLIVNSEYTRGWTLRRLAEVGIGTPPPVHVVAPPVRLLPPRTGVRGAGPLRVVTVGRFFTSGHSKRQDVFLDIVERLRAGGRAVQATLIGSIDNSPEAKAFFQSIESRTRSMTGVEILPDASRWELEQALYAADAYVHCAGYGVRPSINPEMAEHFGISIVEAIAAGCYPVVAAAGGPVEIIRKANVGASFASIDEAVLVLRELATGHRRPPPVSPPWLQDVSDAAFERALHELTAPWSPGEIKAAPALAKQRTARGRVAA